MDDASLTFLVACIVIALGCGAAVFIHAATRPCPVCGLPPASHKTPCLTPAPPDPQPVPTPAPAAPPSWKCVCGNCNPAAAGMCLRCGGPVIGATRGAPFPIPAQASPVAATTAAVPLRAESVNWAGLAWVVIALVSGGTLWGLPRWMGGNVSGYKIRVVTEPAARFHASIGAVSPGDARSRSVDGYGEATYDVGSGMMADAAVQKEGGEGTLTAEVVRDGTVIKSESTSAAYGMVVVAAD